MHTDRYIDQVSWLGQLVPYIFGQLEMLHLQRMKEGYYGTR